jgi:2-dehydro-3-deoxyphosphogalactonate aldolase
VQQKLFKEEFSMSTSNAQSSHHFNSAFVALPLVAILRGILPCEVEEISGKLYEQGFRLIEVPLNSPNALESISLLKKYLPKDAVIGAGTVLSVKSVHQVKDAGGSLIVMPHADVAVIAEAKKNNMICVPGAATLTESFAAINAGADALKLFPAELVTPAALKAMRSVLPAGFSLLPVGGITPGTMADYVRAGASGFGLGSALYTPKTDATIVAQRAAEFVAAWAALATPSAPAASI